MTTPNDIEPKTDPENTESVAGAGCPASPCSAIAFSAEWYRLRAEEVRHNGKTVSQYIHFLGISDALALRDQSLTMLRETLKWMQKVREEGAPGLPMQEGSMESRISDHLLRFDARLQADVTVDEVA